MKVIAKVYNMSKYNPESKKVTEIQYNDVSKIEVIEMTDRRAQYLGFDEVDECGEYLIITHESGETSTFRNSNVDLFRA